ncbi:MAG TPA: hypothetical protein VFR33_09795 [Candidatus Dormibacteraeota bacterium]|nr:hypothetical protein [Candidatus Dormibacteraeota bacterium]
MPTDGLSPRGRRAAAIAALALIVIAAAGLAYLRLNTNVTTKKPSSLPSANPLESGLNPVSFAFVTPSLGWAVVNPYTPSTSVGQFRVFRTVDSAKHWQQQLTGQSSSPGFTPIAVHFFDTSDGYMTVDLASMGEQVYLTSDGGNEWHPIRLPAAQSVVVTFNDPSNGLAAVQIEAVAAQLFKLFATSDRGATWQPLPDPPSDAYGLAFRGPGEAWMGSLGPGVPHVYTSTNAGHTWRRHDLPPPPGRTWDTSGSGTTVQLLPQIGAIATTESGVTGTSQADLFTSLDTGDTWRFVPAPPGEVGYQDAFHWWAIGGTVLSKSSDAGQTWKQITRSLPDWQFMPYVLDANHAWAQLTVLGGYGLGMTIDGGLHWTRANVPQVS